MFIQYDRPTLLRVIELVRKVKPAIVFTASPSDYMIDHEVTGRIAQTACLAASMPNIIITGTTSLLKVPYLYFCDPMQGNDIYGVEIESGIYVNIDSTIGIKEKMLSSHKSQRDWLFKISQVDEYIILMKEFSEKKGKKINCRYAEGFRQFLGFSYPAENILKNELGDLVFQTASY